MSSVDMDNSLHNTKTRISTARYNIKLFFLWVLTYDIPLSIFAEQFIMHEQIIGVTGPFLSFKECKILGNYRSSVEYDLSRQMNADFLNEINGVLFDDECIFCLYDQ